MLTCSVPAMQMKLITTSIVVDRLKINGSLARAGEHAKRGPSCRSVVAASVLACGAWAYGVLCCERSCPTSHSVLLARLPGLKELVNKGLIRLVSYHSKLGIYTRATNVE